MKIISVGSGQLRVPAIALGCMRLSKLDVRSMAHYLHIAQELGVNFYDHADIYGGGECERLFGEALRSDPSLKREEMLIQSKCGIMRGMYDLSRAHILEAVDGILARLGIDYLDILLLHRPDALVEPEEVAEAFDRLHSSGKVRHFGVSNHRPMQIELLAKYVRQPLEINQMQLSLPASGMISGGLEVNMVTEGGIDRDGSVLDYCRLKGLTLQAWSPFQAASKGGPFIGSDSYAALNEALNETAEAHSVSATTIAAAWILRHPANIQLIAGTTNEQRLREIALASNISLSRAEWYRLYLAAGHRLP